MTCWKTACDCWMIKYAWTILHLPQAWPAQELPSNEAKWEWGLPYCPLHRHGTWTESQAGTQMRDTLQSVDDNMHRWDVGCVYTTSKRQKGSYLFRTATLRGKVSRDTRNHTNGNNDAHLWTITSLHSEVWCHQGDLSLATLQITGSFVIRDWYGVWNTLAFTRMVQQKDATGCLTKISTQSLRQIPWDAVDSWLGKASL